MVSSAAGLGDSSGSDCWMMVSSAAELGVSSEETSDGAVFPFTGLAPYDSRGLSHGSQRGSAATEQG